MLSESLVGLGVKYDLYDIVCQFSDREKRKIEPTVKDCFLHNPHSQTHAHKLIHLKSILNGHEEPRGRTAIKMQT